MLRGDNKIVWRRSRILRHRFFSLCNKVLKPRSMNDIRPISHLCFLSKERLIHEQLFSYLETRVLLAPFQTGYRKCHSTQTMLLKLTDDIRGAWTLNMSPSLTSAKHLTQWITWYCCESYVRLTYQLLLMELHHHLLHWIKPSHRDLYWDLSYLWRSLMTLRMAWTL